MERLSLIEDLDERIEGGIPCPSSTLLLGPSGTGKTLFSYQFLGSPSGKEPEVIVTTETSPADVEARMEKYGWDVENLTIIDLYSWRSSMESECEYSVSGMDLNKISINITRAMNEIRKENESPGRFVFHKFSTLFRHVPEELTLRFLSTIKAKTEQNQFALFVVLDEGTGSEKTSSSAASICDGLVRFKLEKGARKFQIEKLKMSVTPPEWVPFKLSDKGVLLKGK